MTSVLNPPNNIMTFYDTKGKRKNLSTAALSIFTPGIIDFIGKQKITGKNESLFDENTDLYVYKNITSSLSFDNIYTNKPNATNYSRNIYSDNVITNYLPFISNCDELGSHITFKNLLENPKCNLVEQNKTTTFKFSNFFAEATGDNCDYTTTCFYDENFDNTKDNWMQFDYSLSREPLMNISKFAINPDMYNKYIKNFTKTIPDDLDQYNMNKFMSTIPLFIETEVTRLKLDSNTVYIPKNIEFTILYYTDELGERTIILAELKLTDFEELVPKNDANFDDVYKNLFPYPENRDPVNSKIYQFYKNQYEKQYMGIDNMIKLNLYSKTSQFKENFADYYDYKNISKAIMDDLDSDFNSQTSSGPKWDDYDPTPEALESHLKTVSAINFANRGSTQKYDHPTTLPDNPTKASDIHDEAAYNDFKDTYKTYYYNAYILNRHFYNFRVVIRPATWLEALNYNAFELYTYLITAVMLLLMIFVLYIILYVCWRFSIFRSLLRLTVNSFNEKKYEKFQFWECHKGCSYFTIKEIFKNNILANLLTTVPISTVAVGFLYLFCHTNIFIHIPSNINEKVTDYNDPRDPNVALMLKRNKLGRFAVALISLGFLTFYYGAILLKPDYEKELLAQNVIKPEQIKERSGQRWNLVKPTFYTILILTIFITSIATFFSFSAIFQIICSALYQLVISTIIINVYNKKCIIGMIIITLLELSIFDLILENTDFNIMLCLYLSYQVTKFFKLLLNDKFSRFYNYVVKKCRKKTVEEKLLQEGHVGQINADMEVKRLNENIIALNELSCYVCSDFIIIPFIGLKLLVLYLTDSSDTDIFNTIVLLIFSSITLITDFINFFLLLKTSTIKDGKNILTIGACSMNAVFIESRSLYQNRNAEFALNSDAGLNDYRKYDDQLINYRRLGYSTQFFMINILFGFTFNFTFFGLSMIIKLQYIPPFDRLIVPLMLGCNDYLI
jgi:hypothetical protein